MGGILDDVIKRLSVHTLIRYSFLQIKEGIEIGWSTAIIEFPFRAAADFHYAHMLFGPEKYQC
jgi:hypothetical protein